MKKMKTWDVLGKEHIIEPVYDKTGTRSRLCVDGTGATNEQLAAAYGGNLQDLQRVMNLFAGQEERGQNPVAFKDRERLWMALLLAVLPTQTRGGDKGGV